MKAVFPVTSWKILPVPPLYAFRAFLKKAREGDFNKGMLTFKLALPYAVYIKEHQARNLHISVSLCSYAMRKAAMERPLHLALVFSHNFLSWTLFGTDILTTPTMSFPWEPRQCGECGRLFLTSCTSTGVTYFALSSFLPQCTHRSWITIAFVFVCCALFVPLPPYDLSNAVRKKKNTLLGRMHAIYSVWAYLPILCARSSKSYPIPGCMNLSDQIRPCIGTGPPWQVLTYGLLWPYRASGCMGSV